MKLRLAVLIAGLAAALAPAQTPRGVVTRALEPAADDLARLNLVPHWRIFLPTEATGDAIATVQPLDDQVFVQLTSGRTFCIQADANAKTFKRAGDVLWTYRPDRPPGIVRPLAVGPTEVYLIQGERITILDRADGKLKYTEDAVSTGSAAPAVDSFALYLPLDNRRIVAYSHVAKIPGYRPIKPYEAPDPVHRTPLVPPASDALSTPQNRSPSIGPLEIVHPPFYRNTDPIDSSVSIARVSPHALQPPYREALPARSPSVGPLPNLRNVYELSQKESVTRIQYLWEYIVAGKIDTTPVLTTDPQVPDSERLHAVSGRVLMTALRVAARTNTSQTEYVAAADITAPLTTIGDTLYLATADSNFIALSIRELREPSTAANTLPRGKFTTGGAILSKPVLTDDSVYVVGDRWGLIRLTHTTLEPMWNEQLPDGRIRPRPNEDVATILSVSPNYIFALDRRGKMVVIDAVRGQTLSRFDVSAFSVPVTNRVNDRVYLASDAGLVICLRERGKVVPQYLMKPAAPAKKAPEAAPAPEPGKDAPPAPKVEAPKAPEVKKEPEAKKEAEPKKEPEAKKEAEPKKEPEAKKEAEPKKE